MLVSAVLRVLFGAIAAQRLAMALEICDKPSETHNMRTADVFLPSGVQTRFYDALGYCPRRLPADAAAYVEVLWAIRNAAPESELTASTLIAQVPIWTFD
jgi:hypothetical protein